ncbi:cytochrome c oxidase assembly protein [Jeotgalibacillus sp. ET6]|uniref:cytochrome c oxidase assembly protein n=1 Tax=Jeotgalibacillus sp. ET6 TaxID=3037260 RepID=UPI0024188A12|nr:cytochrome c oxidase assembly protein [Jeotgalibacillus sp. ET6]MDG5472289.1 cytochrome c oxidase assembly protein [Jeotgalibacillus sp. ET6]
MHDHHTHEAAGWVWTDLAGFLPFAAAIALYISAAILSSRQRRKWPNYRTVLWVLGVLCAAAAVTGPLAERAHTDFTAHMLGHLLLGMLAPLLLVLSAPMTLFLRSVPVSLGRKTSGLLKSRPVRFLSDPITASVLNIGGLWLLYTTTLYSAMHDSLLLHIVIHFHVFAAGYLFTISMIYIDPASHRTPFLYRAVVLIAALAGHGILSKYIYANPPAGVAPQQAESGGMLMYYGGDAIDVMIIIILCYQWYKAAKPRTSSYEMKTSEGAVQ